MKSIWPFSIYFLYFAGIAFVMPFLVLYYQSLGFSGAEIGFLTGLTPLLSIVSAPFWTGLADATRRYQLIMSILMITGSAALAMFAFGNTFTLILLFCILHSLFFSPVTSIIDSATMFMLAERRNLYGRVRLGGTIGFALSAPLAGYLAGAYGLKVLFLITAGLYFLAYLLTFRLVYAPAGAQGLTRAGVLNLLTDRGWRYFLLIVFSGGLGLAATNYYMFSYLKELGASEAMMGMALTLGTISEFPVLFFGDKLLGRFKSYGLLTLTIFITGARMIAFYLCTTPLPAMALQLLGGLTFPAMWIACVSYAAEHAPEGMRATAQGLITAVLFGIGMALGGFIGGPLLVRVGGRGLYLAFGLGMLGILAVVEIVRRRYPAQRMKPVLVE